ncbi:uncharacterized protein LOC121377151 [Gigantopelta aegis]|uniref:uncharacterized protein LOC121377151 n=1 Tax=Gigantopelta aegis TaxID=1735272 RepID=UPI001B88CFD4|nr:uncharacterized protein LOC121377151 [Gigantopelta aegis]
MVKTGATQLNYEVFKMYSSCNFRVQLDSCQSDPCYNGGQCIRLGDKDICACGPNFTGTLCESDLRTACFPNPCLNSNPCVLASNGSFSCNCTDRFEGSLCNKAVLPCQKRPCVRGNCRNGRTTYFCLCPPRYKGRRCEVLNPCFTHPCRNGAKCSGSGSIFKCVCKNGYTGKTCQLDVNECESAPCKNSGTCSNKRGRYTCKCRGGFSGKNCEKDNNPCKKKRCRSPGTKICTPHGWRFTCKCFKGTWGRRCWHLIREIGITTKSNAPLAPLYDYGYKLDGFPSTIFFSVQACKNAIVSLGIDNSFQYGVYSIILGTKDNTVAAITKISPATLLKPKTCSDVVAFKLGSTDGEYWLYPDGVRGQKVQIYCHNMASQPVEYVTLRNMNDGEYPNLENPDCAGEHRLSDTAEWGSSNFTKIRVKVATMEVVRDDYTFVNVSNTPVPYGEAGDCYTAHIEGGVAKCGVKGFFKMDLAGTGLIVDKSLNWSEVGDDAHFEVDRSVDGTVINLRCGGLCGRCVPNGQMFLQINPLEEFSDAITLNEVNLPTLFCNHVNLFWVSWADGSSISLGLGNVVDEETIVTATDSELMDIKNVAVHTEGTTGYWTFNACHCFAGRCTVRRGKYVCRCPYGYSGKYCEHAPRLMVRITPEGDLVEVEEEEQLIVKNASEVASARLEANQAKLDARPKLDLNAAIAKNAVLIPALNLAKPVSFGPDSTKDIDIDAVLGIAPGRKKRSIHKRQASGQKRVIEVLLVVDYAICQYWLQWMSGDEAAAMQEIKDYYSSMLCTIGQRLVSLTGMDVEVWLAKLIIANTTAASSWTTATVVNGSVDTQMVLMAFTRWIYDNMAYLPKHDHAMLISGYDFSLDGNTNSAGRAWDCRMCQIHSVSVVEETHSQIMAIIAAHELGHSMCSEHDGEGNSCAADDHYAMTDTVRIPPRNKMSNPWKYSACTVKAIQTYLSGEHGSCTLQNNEADSGLGAYFELQLGAKYSHDIQCEMAMGNNSCFCRMLYYNNPNGGFTNLCHNMLCTQTGSDFCFPILAQDGTPCGKFKWCQQGQCVQNMTFGPDVYDNCPAGDDPSTDCTGLGVCSMFIFRDILCCKTCLDRVAGVAAEALRNKPTSTPEVLPTDPPVKTFPDVLCPAASTWLYKGNDWMLKWSCPQRLMRRGSHGG